MALSTRAGFSLAQAETERTGVWIDDWSLEQEGTRYRVSIHHRTYRSSVAIPAARVPAWLIELQGGGA